MQIQQLMTREPVTCRSDDNLERAAQLMWEHDVGCVLIVDSEGVLVGILTDRDICMAAYTQGLPLGRICVTSAMAHQLWTCAPQADSRDAEHIMRVHQVHRVPVVDSLGLPVGIVTLNDLARAARASSDASINQREVEYTLAAVSLPRQTVRASSSST
jgi:CBS domain-containing protein